MSSKKLLLLLVYKKKAFEPFRKNCELGHFTTLCLLVDTVIVLLRLICGDTLLSAS